MLLIPFYHRVGEGKYATPLPYLEEHFSWIQKNAQNVLPGDLLVGKWNICLSFDDATFDFYYYIFPLLKKYKLKALLAVPSAYILENATESARERLKKLESFSFQKENFPSPCFCSWEELREMQQSGLVQVASHSHSHTLLIAKETDLSFELSFSKKTLSEKLGSDISTFVFPYGKCNQSAVKEAAKYYSYQMRVGSSANFSWATSPRLLYRIPADGSKNIQNLFSLPKRIQGALKFLLNRLQKK